MNSMIYDWLVSGPRREKSLNGLVFVSGIWFSLLKIYAQNVERNKNKNDNHLDSTIREYLYLVFC